MQEELEEAIAQHAQIIQAIARRDGETAGDIVRQHLDLSRRNMAMYVTPDGVDAQLGAA